MFGLRIVREDDLMFARAEKVGLDNEIRTLHDKIEALHVRLTKDAAQTASACTMRDMLVTRVNCLEEECAVLKHKLTGLPQIAPKIEKGSALASSAMGAQVDLFEDVGDEKARELQDKGLLHADEAPPLMSGAADLTRHLN